MGTAKALVRLRPTMFGFQLLLVARPNPTLHMLLARAQTASSEKAGDMPGKGASAGIR